MQPREAECSEGFAANGWSSKIASRAKLKETCGVHRPDATTARIFAADFLQVQQALRPGPTIGCTRPLRSPELPLQHDIDAALGDGGVARAGLADRHLPEHRGADAVLCQFVGDDLAARLGEPLVGGGRAGGAGARLDADGAARVSRPRCAALAMTACASGVRLALNSSK